MDKFDIRLGIFARPPIPGRVKTRLAATVGSAAAARVYRHCLEYTLQLARSSGLDYQIFLSDAVQDDLFYNESYVLQAGDNLGTRMQKALAELLIRSPGGAILVGSDCIDLNQVHLQQAARALATHDLVLQPATDGGYTLIGCRDAPAALFAGVDWSTERVLSQSLANAEGLGFRVCLLETLRDIDTLHDLEHYPDLLKLVTLA